MEDRKTVENAVSSKLIDENDSDNRGNDSEELTLPEKLCRFYVERPKLAFGKSFVVLLAIFVFVYHGPSI